LCELCNKLLSYFQEINTYWWTSNWRSCFWHHTGTVTVSDTIIFLYYWFTTISRTSLFTHMFFSDETPPLCSIINRIYVYIYTYTIDIYIYIHRVSIKSFPDYKYILQENYVEYKYIFFLTLVKLVFRKKTSWITLKNTLYST
jgi:hypothetical protein